MFHSILEKSGFVSSDGVLERASWRQHERGFFLFWRDGLAGKQGCKHDWRLGCWQEGGEEVPFYVSSIILATLPGLCADSLGGGGWGLLRPVTRRPERLSHITVCLLFQTCILLFPCHPSSSHPSHDIPSENQTHFLKYFLSYIRPSFRVPSSVFFLSSSFLCSAGTLSSLPHALVQAYIMLEFYCHFVYTGESEPLWLLSRQDSNFYFNLIPVSSMEGMSPQHKSWAYICFSRLDNSHIINMVCL